MNKYILPLFILVLTVCTSCKPKKSKSHTDPIKSTEQTDPEVQKLAKLTKGGPLFIGEDHNDPTARSYIMKLIEKGCVQKLFLELDPEMHGISEKPEERKAFKEDIMSVVLPYLNSIDRNLRNTIPEEFKVFTMMLNFWENGSRNNPIKMGQLIQAALESQYPIAIYLHDRPGSFADEKEGPLKRLQARNAFSGNFIQEKGLGAGTVILAGWGHLDETEVGRGHTLQELLGCANEEQRVILYKKPDHR